MPPAKTEERRDNAKGLDVMRPELALRLLAAGQQEAAKSVEQAIEPISAAARLAADSLASGGRLAYAGAGSSGLMAMADALELPGTYGIAREQVVILIAGGAASLTDLAGGYEDDMELARADVRSAGIGAGDCLISVSASGSTPYAIAAADEAGKRGARVIGMANNAGAPLLLNADVSILLRRLRKSCPGRREWVPGRLRRSPSTCSRPWSASISATCSMVTWSICVPTTSNCAAGRSGSSRT